jgi:hypothetical protein
MAITSFMSIIVFSFLLFMEGETNREARHRKLGLSLGDLQEKLEMLRDNILNFCSIVDDFYAKLEKQQKNMKYIKIIDTLEIRRIVSKLVSDVNIIRTELGENHHHPVDLDTRHCQVFIEKVVDVQRDIDTCIRSLSRPSRSLKKEDARLLKENLMRLQMETYAALKLLPHMPFQA